MTNHNPFNTNEYDLGVGEVYGYDIHTATDNILRTAYSDSPRCYVCGNTPHLQVLAKKSKYINAEIQNGLYVCNHCIKLKPIDSKMYGIKEL